MSRELPVRPGKSAGRVARAAIVFTVSALVTVIFLWNAGAPPKGDPRPYPTVAGNAAGA